jgi:hypothetical protein
MTNTIYGSFTNADNGEKAAGALMDHGVRPEDISLIRCESSEYQAPDDINGVPVQGEPIGTNVGASPYDRPIYGLGRDVPSPLMADVGAAGWTGVAPVYAAESYEALEAWQETDLERAAKEGISTTTPEDVRAGATKGMAWGLGIGALAALASIAVPGVGLVVGGGALATALTGAAATVGAGALAGGVTGHLMDQGVEEQTAMRYTLDVSNGGALISVAVPSGNLDEQQVRLILEKYGASFVYTGVRRGYVA